MASENEFAQLVDELVSKTEAGALRWEGTASEDIYVAAHSAHGQAFTFMISREKIGSARDNLPDSGVERKRPLWHYKLVINDRTSGEKRVSAVGPAEVGDSTLLQRLFDLAGSASKHVSVRKVLDVLRAGS